MTTAANTAAEFNLDEVTFGVEIETHIPYGTIPIGRYHHGIDVEALPGWKVEYDSSINHPFGREDCEFISPVLKGADGLRQVVKAIEYIKSIGGMVNASCGFHVHVGWNGNGADLERLVYNVSRHEKGIYASTGTKSRENGRYTKSIQNNDKYHAKFIRKESVTFDDHDDRYSVLNLTNLTHRPAVEFRAFSGTLNVAKAIGFIRISLAMIHKTKVSKRKSAWVRKDGSQKNAAFKRRGPGERSLESLFWAMGWVKASWIKHPIGVIEADGIPTLEESKKVLYAMAAKYDSTNGHADAE